MGATSSLLTRPASASQYSNPVINSDFPDPNCIKVADIFYVFATNFGEMQATTSHIQLATSKDLIHYRIRSDALPILPQWAKPGRTWAPNVTHIQDSNGSTFVLFFVAWDIESDRQAIGTATSKNPEGPYEPTSSKPFILQVGLMAMTAHTTAGAKCSSCVEQHCIALLLLLLTTYSVAIIIDPGFEASGIIFEMLSY